MTMGSRTFGLVACSLLLLAGCSRSTFTPETGVTVKGRIVQDGVPLHVPHRDVALGMVEVQLVPEGMLALGPREETSLQVEGGLADENGVFEIRGAGRGVPPGKYRLAVYQRGQGYGSDALQGAFSVQRSAIEVDIPADRLGRTLDLGTIELNDHKKP